MTGARTLTLAEFLLARIAEDEATARAVSEGAWASVDWDSLGAYEHGTRWSPSHVLAECEEKRLMIAQLEREVEYLDAIREDTHHRFDDVIRRVLGPLAMSYSNHPDYREDWRP